MLAPVFDLWSEAPYPGVGIVGVDVGERVIVAAASASEMGWDVDLATIADPLLARITSWIAVDGDVAALAGRIRAFLAAIAKGAPERFPDGYPQVEALVAVAERDAVRVWSIGGGLVQHVPARLRCCAGEHRGRAAAQPAPTVATSFAMTVATAVATRAVPSRTTHAATTVATSVATRAAPSRATRTASAGATRVAITVATARTQAP